MAKKAALDILEIAPEEPGMEIALAEEASGKTEETEPAAEQTGGDFHGMVIKWLRKPLFWVIFASLAMLGLASGVWVGFQQSLEEHVTAVRGPQAADANPQAAARRGIPCEGVVVDQKDEKGNIRILFCDIVLELEDPRTGATADGDRIDVRRAIHDVLKRELPQEGLSPEGRGRLKEKLKNGLKGLFGGNPVKEVYFTRFEMD